jgi:hypothetical protein
LSQGRGGIYDHLLEGRERNVGFRCRMGKKMNRVGGKFRVGPTPPPVRKEIIQDLLSNFGREGSLEHSQSKEYDKYTESLSFASPVKYDKIR